MGNNQSQGQDSDNENERSTYNYHENVLRDAQQLSDGNLGEHETDDVYLSADEGDSDRSVTPPRTRPESSSGEDFSDDSESDNGQINTNEESQGNTNESNASCSISPEKKVEFLTPSVKKRTVKKSCGQCNVSRFQEHDSIGPELDTSRWDVNTSSISARSIRHSQRSQGQASCSDVSNHHQTSSSSSPFKPINSPSVSYNITPNSNKRKATSPSGTMQSQSPKKKLSIRISPSKRRLGLIDDSDCDDSDEESVKVIKKKPCLSSDSLSPGNSQIDSPSVIKIGRPKIKRIMEEKKDDDEECHFPSDTKIIKLFPGTETLKGNVLGEKRVYEGYPDINEGEQISNSQNMKKLKTDERQEITKLDDHHEAKQTLAVGRGVKRLQVSAFQPIKRAHVVSNVEEETSNSVTRTVKMGNNAVRNSQGKVLPIRQSCQVASSSSSSDAVTEPLSQASIPVQTSYSDSILSKNNTNTRSLRQRKKIITQSGDTTTGEEMNQNFSSASDHITQGENQIWNISHNSNKASPIENENSVDNSTSQSPFHNVVLTPPSHQVSATHSTSELHSKDKDEIIAMETEEPQETSLLSSSLDTNSNNSNHRIFAKAKRLSATERFKNFLTDGNLTSNFRSLFSKKKRGKNEIHPNTSDESSWSLYSSPSCSFGQSPFTPQCGDYVQSTSSPMVTPGHSLIADNVSFSPICNVSDTPSPTSHQVKTNSSTLSLVQDRKGLPRKSASTTHTPTRTSPRLRHFRTSPTTNTANTSNLSASSLDGSGSSLSSNIVQQLPQTSQFEVIHYCLSQTVEISLTMGDISDRITSGIVNWTDESLTHTFTECSRRICTKAGALMRAVCNSYLENKDGLLEAPDVLTTPAGGSFPRVVKALLHVVSPPSNNCRLGACLLEVNANCLRFANERLHLESLSVPLIGEGELPTQLCAEAFIDAVLLFITEKKPQSSSLSSSSSTNFELTSIHLVTGDANITDEAAEVIQARIDFVKSNGLKYIAADIQDRYYGIQQESSISKGDNNDIEEESLDRAKSGRPRVKRPRL